MSVSPYLVGAFAPIDDEIEAVLEFEGDLPRDLNGSYVRNGPNPRLPPEGRYHFFDGDGMLHAVHFEDGHATYRNRWVKTSGLSEELAAGEPLWRGVMEPIKRKDVPYKDTANTDVVYFNGKLLALWYICGQPYLVDPHTLETIGVADFGAPRPTPMSAHAHVDHQTGELLFFNYGMRAPYMNYGVIGPDGVQTHFTPIELPGPRLPHDMAFTANHSIVMDVPMVFDAEALARGRWVTRFDTNLRTRFGVIPRHGTEVRWFEAEPCYIYHAVNAWEEDDEIVLTACRVTDPLPAPRESDGEWARMMANLRVTAHLHRWRFDLKTGDVTEETIDDRNTEFPTMREDMAGRRSRHTYNVSLADSPTLEFDGLVKYDIDTGAAQTLSFGPHHAGSEAPFAPRTNSTEEDDGYLTTFVTDKREGTSELWILDAKNIESGPIAKARLPRRVPLGFHATWVPKEQS